MIGKLSRELTNSGDVSSLKQYIIHVSRKKSSKEKSKRKKETKRKEEEEEVCVLFQILSSLVFFFFLLNFSQSKLILICLSLHNYTY